MIHTFKLFILMALVSSSAAWAQSKVEYTCSYKSAVRKIYVHYAAAGKSVPCEVYYIRDVKAAQSAEDKTNPALSLRIYSYKNEAGQCEIKAKEFSEKLGKMGYSCK